MNMFRNWRCVNKMNFQPKQTMTEATYDTNMQSIVDIERGRSNLSLKSRCAGVEDTGESRASRPCVRLA